MLVGRNAHILIAAILGCGLVAIAWVSRSVNQSYIARLSVSSVEKAQQLENRISQRLANEELAKWNKLESQVFPSHLEHRAVKDGKVLQHKKLALQKPMPAIFFSKGSGKHSTDIRFRQAVHPLTPSRPVLPVKMAHSTPEIRTQKKALQVNIGNTSVSGGIGVKYCFAGGKCSQNVLGRSGDRFPR